MNKYIMIITIPQYSAHLSLHQTIKARYRHFTAHYKVYLIESFIEEMGLKLLYIQHDTRFYNII